ncbi:hypothetical protein [Paenibacillus silvestris]|nr:hypothetical protein [Paenibacillus silvestris]
MKIRWVRVHHENQKYEKILEYARWLAASTTVGLPGIGKKPTGGGGH